MATTFQNFQQPGTQPKPAPGLPPLPPPQPVAAMPRPAPTVAPTRAPRTMQATANSLPPLAPPPNGPANPAGQVNQFASNWMNQANNGNRFTADATQSRLGMLDARRAQRDRAGTAGIEERIAGRGVLGSTIEEGAHEEFRQNSEAQMRADEAQLLTEMAGIDANDRAAAGQFGIAASEFGRQQGRDAESDRQFDQRYGLESTLGMGNLGVAQQQANQQREQYLGQLGISQQEVGLRAQQIQQEAALQGRQMSIQEAQNLASNGIARDRLQQEGQQFATSSAQDREQYLLQNGISQQQVTQEAQRIANQAAQFGQTITLDQARFQAESSLAERTLSQRASEFGVTSGQDQQRINNQSSQFGQSQVQQESQFARDLEIRSRAQQLTAQGMSQDEAFRRAELEQNYKLEQKRLELSGIRTGLEFGVDPDGKKTDGVTGTPEEQRKKREEREKGVAIAKRWGIPTRTPKPAVPTGPATRDPGPRVDPSLYQSYLDFRQMPLDDRYY